METEKQKISEWLSYLEEADLWDKPKIGFAYICDRFVGDEDVLLTYKECLVSEVAKNVIANLNNGEDAIKKIFGDNCGNFSDQKRLGTFITILCKMYGLNIKTEFCTDKDGVEDKKYQLDLSKRDIERSADDYYNMACAQKTNRGIENKNLYIECMKKASEMGHVHAMQCMARFYLRGKFVQKDEARGVQLYKKCAEMQDGVSCYELYKYYHEKGGEGTKERRYLELAAEYNVAAAQYDLAMTYYNNATDHDYVKAALLLKTAAENGDPGAHYQLALCYRYGHGVQKDMDLAMEFLLEAAKRGHSEAKRILEQGVS